MDGGVGMNSAPPRFPGLPGVCIRQLLSTPKAQGKSWGHRGCQVPSVPGSSGIWREGHATHRAGEVAPTAPIQVGSVEDAGPELHLAGVQTAGGWKV